MSTEEEEEDWSESERYVLDLAEAELTRETMNGDGDDERATERGSSSLRDEFGS
jgi:hypothetical protein